MNTTVDGWILNVFTEKNKLAPSHYSIPLVFDKKYGVIPIWSEYYFLSKKTKTENKYWPKEKKMPYPLLIDGATDKRVLEVISPETGEVLYTSPKFNERKFLDIYNTDPTFRQWFDYGVTVSAQQRIEVALFRNSPGPSCSASSDAPEGVSELGEYSEALAAPEISEAAVPLPEEVIDENQDESDY